MKKVLTILMISVLCVTMLTAASSAEKIYNDFSNAVDSGDITTAMKKYSDLESRVSKEKNSIASSIEKAVKKNNRELYYSSLSDLEKLNSYKITKDLNDKFLTVAIKNDDSAALTWLYENSFYYSPTLTLTYSSSSKGRISRYSSTISACPGSEITLPTSNEMGINTLLNGELTGWGITKDEVTYKPGEKIKMPNTDQTLYAIFTPGVSFKDSVTGTDSFITANGGDEVNVPILEHDGMIFEGWYDSASGIYISPENDSWSVKGNGASFKALWKALDIRTLSTGVYETTALPTQTQIPISVTIQNSGSEDITGLKYELLVEDESVTLIDNSAYSRILRSGSSVNFTGIKLVATNEAKGKTIPISVKVTDDSNTVFSTTFNVTFK